MQYMVMWAKDSWAAVSATGDVLDASDTVSRQEVLDRLAAPALVWVDAGDFLQTLKPGDAGHVKAVLSQMPQAVVTDDA